MIDEFTHRLRAAMDRGDLSNADVVVWFERSRKTVWEWTRGRYAPRPPGRRDADHRLSLLEAAVRDNLFPTQISQRERHIYVKAKRDEQLAKSNGLPVADPA